MKDRSVAVHLLAMAATGALLWLPDRGRPRSLYAFHLHALIVLIASLLLAIVTANVIRSCRSSSFMRRHLRIVVAFLAPFLTYTSMATADGVSLRYTPSYLTSSSRMFVLSYNASILIRTS